MKYQRNALNATAALILLMLSATVALSQCNVANLKDPAQLAKTSLVIDVRPDQINQFRGKTAFREQAHIFLTNMNPFLFGYRIQVAQTEVQDTGFLNFLNLLGSPVSDIIGSPASIGRSANLSATGGGSLQLLIDRTDNPPANPNSSCEAANITDAKNALAELALVRDKVVLEKDTVESDVNSKTTLYEGARKAFGLQKDIIFNSSTGAKQLCESANKLYTDLNSAPANVYPSIDDMNKSLHQVEDLKSMIDELESSARDYIKEYDKCPARAKGLSYPDNLIRLAAALRALAAEYEAKVNALIKETKSYNALKGAISRLETQDPNDPTEKVNNTLQREYTVFGQYDISALDITVTPEPLGTDSGLPVQKDLTDRRFDVVGSTQSTHGSGGSVRIINAGADDLGGIKVFAPRGRAASVGADGGGDKGEDGGGEKGGAGGDSGGGGGESNTGKEIKHSATIGWRRFELSGGMAFSSLDKREFQPVLGYARNEQGVIVGDDGQPTDKRELTTIVGVSENSGRRISPIAMLHYRMPYMRSVFASVGVTGKRDSAGTDLEYLLGPSFLFRNMFFTLGGYAGKQQHLAGDLFLGAKLPGTTVPVQKDYRWGPGFSFTYKVPLGKPKTEH
jgi:hypothetical protein